MAVPLKTVPSSSHTLSPQNAADLGAAREVLSLEANALLALGDALDENFTKALDLILSRPGRIIVTGMGKPGHVSKKIAATLASTGTPAYFVHPGEASHGDLGMIGENDAVLILSKSGETKELRDLVQYCKRFTIPMIAITSDKESTLADQADIVLLLPQIAEACPNQQAPTTSTTLMIALGDALAIALMKRRGFSAQDFRQYHPGGKLGGQLLSVSQVMQQGEILPLVADTATVDETIRIMSAHNFGCAIVTDAHNELAGFVSDGDLRRHLAPNLAAQNVTAVMGKNPRTIEVNALAAAALALMNQYNITQLVVTDGKQPVGLIRLHDIMRAGVA